MVEELYCGYLPLSWMRQIGSTAERRFDSVRVAALIWHRAGVERRGDRLPISRKRASDCVGLYPMALYRGVEQLERLGLITTERQHGRAIRVSIVDFDQYKRGGVRQ